MDHIIEQAEAIRNHLYEGNTLDIQQQRMLADVVVKLAWRMDDIEDFTKTPDDFISERHVKKLKRFQESRTNPGATDNTSPSTQRQGQSF